MEIIALNDKQERISLSVFFEKFGEFQSNSNLMQQVVRTLKVLQRHPEDIGVIAEMKDDAYEICVSGNNRTYTIKVQLRNNVIVLLNLQ